MGVRLAGEPDVARRTDTMLGGSGDGEDGAVDIAPRLDLDADDEIAAPRDDVDLAEFRAVADRADTVTFGEKIERGEIFGDVAPAEGFQPVGVRRLIPHRHP